MCLGNDGSDQAAADAAEARRREAERAARIRAGASNINNAFAKYDDGFFDNRRQSYLDFANPQLDDQFKDATRELTLALARSGILNSSAKSRRFGDLQTSYDNQSRAVSDKANEYVNNTRSAIELAKSDLLSQNQAMADPALAANLAANRATTATAMPAYSPLNQVFASVTEGIATQADLERRGKARYQMSDLFGGGNSSKVVA